MRNYCVVMRTAVIAAYDKHASSADELSVLSGSQLFRLDQFIADDRCDNRMVCFGIVQADV